MYWSYFLNSYYFCIVDKAAYEMEISNTVAFSSINDNHFSSVAIIWNEMYFETYEMFFTFLFSLSQIRKFCYSILVNFSFVLQS